MMMSCSARPPASVQAGGMAKMFRWGFSAPPVARRRESPERPGFFPIWTLAKISGKQKKNGPGHGCKFCSAARGGTRFPPTSTMVFGYTVSPETYVLHPYIVSPPPNPDWERSESSLSSLFLSLCFSFCTPPVGRLSSSCCSPGAASASRSGRSQVSTSMLARVIGDATKPSFPRELAADCHRRTRALCPLHRQSSDESWAQCWRSSSTYSPQQQQDAPSRAALPTVIQVTYVARVPTLPGAGGLECHARNTPVPGQNDCGDERQSPAPKA